MSTVTDHAIDLNAATSEDACGSVGNDICPAVMLRHEASSSPCITAMLVEEDPSCLRMTVFLNYVMGMT
ncbi:hypothetical protein [Mucilaginibacter sp.]|uniref:hypothetical protein n=1 Tax=Mucilaginibacter sp. TaxID=1882438 RepID=UPI002ED14DFD